MEKPKYTFTDEYDTGNRTKRIVITRTSDGATKKTDTWPCDGSAEREAEAMVAKWRAEESEVAAMGTGPIESLQREIDTLRAQVAVYKSALEDVAAHAEGRREREDDDWAVIVEIATEVDNG